MLRTSITLNKIVFQQKEYRRDMRNYLAGTMIKGMIRWVRAATHAVDGTFPVKTGMAKGSFKNLVEWIEKNKANYGVGESLAFDISPKTYAVKGKNVRAGREQSAQGNFLTILSNQYGPHTIRFNWWTEVPHFIYNEDNVAPEKLNLKHTTPWHAIQAGDIALGDYLNTHLGNMPRIDDYIVWLEK